MSFRTPITSYVHLIIYRQWLVIIVHKIRMCKSEYPILGFIYKRLFMSVVPWREMMNIYILAPLLLMPHSLHAPGPRTGPVEF